MIADCGVDGIIADRGTEVSGGKGIVSVVAPEGTAVQVFNTSGALVYSGTSHTIPLKPGIYIVRAGGLASKALVK